VNGGANLFPKLYVRLCEAARADDLAHARELQALVLRLSTSLYCIGRHSSSVIRGLKCALACLGVCDDFMAEPFHRFRAGERAEVERPLKKLTPDLEKPGLAS